MSGSRIRIAGCLVVALTATACGDTPAPTAPDTPTTSSTTLRAAPPPVTPTATMPRTQDWVNLKVGDCVAGVPAVELGEVGVTMSECTTPHQAEVYLLTPIAVNAALTDVANRECAAGLSPYVGGAASDFAVTYLIDSRQDRTDNNPLPSTVICLLQSADGQPLTGSARQ